MRSLHGSYLMVSYVMWQLPPALPPYRVSSPGKVCLANLNAGWEFPLVCIPFISKHLLVKGHEHGLAVWPLLRFFLKSDVLRLKCELSLIPNHARLEHLNANFNFQSRMLRLPTKSKYALTYQPPPKKKKFTERFKKKLWLLVIWWRPGLAPCLGCKDWKSTNDGLLSVQD